MGNRIVRPIGRKFSRKREFGHQPPRADISKRLRFSDINVKNKIAPVQKEINRLLFKLNVQYNQNFNPNKEICPTQLSDVLIVDLCDHFDIENPLSLMCDDEKIIVDIALKHDLYHLDLKPFSKLKLRAPVLYHCFYAFVFKSEIGTFDDFEKASLYENSIFDDEEFCIEFFDANTRKIEEAKKSILKNKKIIDDLKEQNLNIQDCIEALKKYNSKNEKIQRIKNFVLKWCSYDFTFLNNYPVQHYSNFCSEEIYYDYQNYICFIHNNNKIVNKMIETNFEDIYNNQIITSPCWLISEKENQHYIGKSIKEFEVFVEEYNQVLTILKTL